MMLLDAFPPHFALLDAYDSAADGLVGVMGCPSPGNPDGSTPRPMHSRWTSSPRGTWGCDPRHSSILRAACHWFGEPSGRVEVVGVDEPLAEWRGRIGRPLRLVEHPRPAGLRLGERARDALRPRDG